MKFSNKNVSKIIIWFFTVGALVLSILIISNNFETKHIYNFQKDYVFNNKEENFVKYIDSSDTKSKYNELISFSEYLGRLGKSKVIEQYMISYPDEISYSYKSWGDTILALKGDGFRNDLIFDELMRTEIASELRVKTWQGIDSVYFLWILLPILVYFVLTFLSKKIISNEKTFMNFRKLIMWIMNAFFWGIGLMLASVVINGFIYDITPNILLRSMLIIFLGGIVMHFYHIINDKENYKKNYKDIFK